MINNIEHICCNGLTPYIIYTLVYYMYKKKQHFRQKAAVKSMLPSNKTSYLKVCYIKNRDNGIYLVQKASTHLLNFM